MDRADDRHPSPRSRAPSFVHDAGRARAVGDDFAHSCSSRSTSPPWSSMQAISASVSLPVPPTGTPKP